VKSYEPSRSEREPCTDFRAALARALEGRPQPRQLVELGWHEHLLDCAACRELLDREEALELLLATLPEPQLPPELSRRVVRRLAPKGLDSLLDLDDAAVPAGLAQRVQRAMRAEALLDDLLERDRVVQPVGLATSVLAGLERERYGAPERPRLRALRKVLVYSAAAGLLMVLVLNRDLFLGAGGTNPKDAPGLVRNESEPDPALLEMLHVLEREELWDGAADAQGVALAPTDLELLLSESVDIDDEFLLAFLEDPSDD